MNYLKRMLVMASLGAFLGIVLVGASSVFLPPGSMVDFILKYDPRYQVKLHELSVVPRDQRVETIGGVDGAACHILMYDVVEVLEVGDTQVLLDYLPLSIDTQRRLRNIDDFKVNQRCPEHTMFIEQKSTFVSMKGEIVQNLRRNQERARLMDAALQRTQQP